MLKSKEVIHINIENIKLYYDALFPHFNIQIKVTIRIRNAHIQANTLKWPHMGQR